MDLARMIGVDDKTPILGRRLGPVPKNHEGIEGFTVSANAQDNEKGTPSLGLKYRKDSQHIRSSHTCLHRLAWCRPGEHTV